MIYKRSLLKEYKADNRPIHGCVTYAQHLNAMLWKRLDTLVAELHKKREEQTLNWLESLKHWRVNYPKHTKGATNNDL